MANATPSRLGQVNGAGAADDLFLKVFPGEVMGAFDKTTAMMTRHRIRTISHGKSAQFPATGRATAAYHVPGTQLLGTSTINHAERVINIDSLLTADTFVANFDEAMNHYDVRSEYSHQLGEALGNKCDAQLSQVAVLTARAVATVTGEPAGTRLLDADAATNGASLAATAYVCAQTFDEKFIPQSDRMFFVKPAQYWLLVQVDKLTDRDHNTNAGSYMDGDVRRVADMELVKNVNIPSAVIAAESGTNNTYDGFFTHTVAFAIHRSAIGTVKLLDLAVEKEYQVGRQGTLMVAKYAMGHGILRPEAAIEVASNLALV